MSGLRLRLRRTGGGAPESDFDTSEYRQNTYGAPTHYCDPTRALNDNGDGTLGDPWNLSQAAANAAGGDVVGVMDGVGVILTSTDDDNIPTFRPANSGTLENPIVFVTRYAAIALANVETNALRTQLRHDGIAEVANTAPGPESGSAMYGCRNTNYCIFDGFYVDMASAQPKTDSGVLHAEGATGIQFRNYVIKGTTTNMHSNPVIYRAQDVVDCVHHNWRVYDFINTGAGATQPGLFSDQYGDENYLHEYGEYSNGQVGPYAKGTAPAGVGFNYGTMRYLRIFDVDKGIQLNDFHASSLTEIHHCLIYNYRAVGLDLSAETSDPRQLLFHHNTVANGSATGGGANGPVAISSSADTFTNVTLRDNIFDWVSASAGRGVEAGEHAEATFPTMDYNRYYRAGNTVQWSKNGTDYNTIGAWRTATGQEGNSDVFATDPFTDRDADDYTIADGHAALTASSTNGEVGCFEGGEIPGPYGSYGF